MDRTNQSLQPMANWIGGLSAAELGRYQFRNANPGVMFASG